MNSEYPRPTGLDLVCIDSAGNRVQVQPRAGVTLGAGTYFFLLPAVRSNLVSVQLKWALTVAGVFTVEDCNFPEDDSAGGSDESDRVDITDFSVVVGDWQQENPSTAIVGVSGTGNTSTAATVTAGGTNQGGCMFHIGNIGARRVRIKAVITTGGLVRAAGWGKGA